MPEGLERRHGEARAGLELAARRGLYAGADNLAAIGAEIDDHGEIGRGHLVHLDADAGQTEEDEEELDQERRIPNQLDIGSDQGLEPARAERARPGAGNAEEDAEHGADQRQLQSDDDALDQDWIIFGEPAEVEMIAHGKMPRSEGPLRQLMVRSVVR